MNTEQVSDRIKQLCKSRKTTIQEMLDFCKLNRNFMYDLKNNRIPSADKFEQIADYLDCSVDYLLGRTDQKETSHTAEFTDLFERLTLEQQELVLSQLKGILSSRES